VKSPITQGQRVGQIVEQGMPACLRFKGKRKRRICIDIDRIDRIHLDRNGKSHADLLTCRLIYHTVHRWIIGPVVAKACLIAPADELRQLAE
jgi:hypothetical protein